MIRIGLLARLIFPILFFPAYLLTLNAEAPDLSLAFYEYGLLYHQGEGIDADVVRELERRSGRTFTSSVLARARIWKDLESGALDMTVSGIATPEREKFAWFIPYFSMKNSAVLLKNPGTALGPESFLSADDWMFGAVASFRHGGQQDEFLESLRKQKRVEEAPDAATLFQKLRARRIQGMFSQPPVYTYYLRTLEMEHLVKVVDWFPEETPVPHGLVLSKQRFDEAQFRYWEGLIREMKRDGTLERILIRHLGDGLGRLLAGPP